MHRRGLDNCCPIFKHYNSFGLLPGEALRHNTAPFSFYCYYLLYIIIKGLLPHGQVKRRKMLPFFLSTVKNPYDMEVCFCFIIIIIFKIQ